MSEETILVAFSHDGKKFELEVDPERPISHLMDRIEELTDVPPGNMKGNIYGCNTFCQAFRYEQNLFVGF